MTPSALIWLGLWSDLPKTCIRSPLWSDQSCFWVSNGPLDDEEEEEENDDDASAFNYISGWCGWFSLWRSLSWMSFSWLALCQLHICCHKNLPANSVSPRGQCCESLKSHEESSKPLLSQLIQFNTFSPAEKDFPEEVDGFSLRYIHYSCISVCQVKSSITRLHTRVLADWGGHSEVSEMLLQWFACAFTSARDQTIRAIMYFNYR